jgi:kynureninase
VGNSDIILIQPSELHRSPNAIAADYSRFQVSERLLLTGHSHQAWPDVAFDGVLESYNDSATLVDDKWPRAFEKAEAVRAGYARLLHDAPDRIALAENTHELVIKFLSALPLKKRRRIVTTDGEYHSVRRQLDRLAEEGLIELVKVPVAPIDDLASRLAEAVSEATAAVTVSSVLFRTGQIVPGLPRLAQVCEQRGAELLIDAYHQVNIVPFDPRGLEHAFVTGAGYKYVQAGEGNAFLRLPSGRAMRPVITGWFAEFETKEAPVSAGVQYGRGPWRFAGATYDPTANYRAAAVFDYFARRELTPELLRSVSQHQIGLIASSFDALDLNPSFLSRDRSLPLESIAGFMVLRSPRAGEICHALHDAGVFTDYRADALRIGPAPYLSDAQIEEAMRRLGDVVRGMK